MLQKTKEGAQKTHVYSHKLVYLVILAILFFSLSGLPCLAQGLPSATNQFSLNQVVPPPLQQQPSIQSDRVAPAEPARQGPTAPQEVEAFMDQFFTQEEMKKKNVPGAAIALVKDGKLLFTKGYGYANLEKKIPVVADKTLFRVASISKLFTDTAVMQMYERGLLNLDEDVNHYLKRFQLENNYPQPVTAAHLMTMTAGSSQRVLGIAAPTASEMVPLQEFIPERMPPFVRPPGKLYGYSNMGVTLLGYMVEVISGLPFIQYIDENILEPLDMGRSTFRQSLPPHLADDLAQGYWYRNGSFEPFPFMYLNIFPAASLSATATDMAHFMIAHLQSGRYENSRILEADTAQLMHRQHFSQHPKLPGTAYGFHEHLENNIRAIGHLGSLIGYSSSLTLLPAQNVGLFITSNSSNGIHVEILTQFFDHYYPVQDKPAPPQPPTDFSARSDRFTGTYRDLEYPRDTFVKLTAPFYQIDVKASGNNTLSAQFPDLLFPGTRKPIELIPVEPLLFQRADGDGYTGFGKDSRGRIAYSFVPYGEKIATYEKIPWYETIIFQLILAGFCVVIFLSACIIWPGGYLIRRLRKQRFRAARPARLARLVAGLISVLYLVFLFGFGLGLWLTGWKLVYGVPAILVALLYIPPVAIGLTFTLPVFTVLAWKNKYWSVWGRAHYSLMTLAALAFIPFLLYWKLAGVPV